MLVMTISLSSQSGSPPAFPQQHLAIGLTLGAMIFSLDHISGAHFNPAVTLGAVLNQRLDIVSAAFYVVAQVAGGICGGLTALGIASQGNIKPFSPNASAPWGATGSAFAVEFLFTMAVCLVMQNAAMEKNAREPNSYFGIAVAFTVLAGARAVGPISGGWCVTRGWSFAAVPSLSALASGTRLEEASHRQSRVASHLANPLSPPFPRPPPRVRAASTPPWAPRWTSRPC